MPGIASPIERFDSVLREFVRIAREHEIQLVSQHEPITGDQRLPRKDEFRATLRAIASEIGAAVVHPTCARAEGIAIGCDPGA